jgi:hypothetical protein
MSFVVEFVVLVIEKWFIGKKVLVVLQHAQAVSIWDMLVQ